MNLTGIVSAVVVWAVPARGISARLAASATGTARRDSRRVGDIWLPPRARPPARRKQQAMAADCVASQPRPGWLDARRAIGPNFGHGNPRRCDLPPVLGLAPGMEIAVCRASA